MCVDTVSMLASFYQRRLHGTVLNVKELFGLRVEGEV